MIFRVASSQQFAWPDEAGVTSVLHTFGLHLDDMHSALRLFSDNTDPAIKRYTEALAANLADHLARSLPRNGVRATTRQITNRYCPAMDHHADMVMARPGSDRHLFFEIEFRPNFEKDLVKFRVGHNAGRLAAGIIVVAVKRRNIRATYTSMPEFESVVCVVREFRPDHPILVLGIDGVIV